MNIFTDLSLKTWVLARAEAGAELRTHQDLNQKRHNLFYRIWKFVAHNPYYSWDMSSQKW